jgi:hypothetical protein
MTKKIIDVRKDDKGVITDYLLEGNQNFTSKETAIRMVKNGTIVEVNVAESRNENEYIRSNPNKKKKDNLGNL